MPELGRKGVLAADAVTVDVAQVIGRQYPARRRADETSRHPASRANVVSLHIDRAADSNQPEEDEDEDFSQPRITVRVGAPSIEPGSENTDDPHGDKPPMPGHDRDDQSGHCRDREAREGRNSDVGGFGQP